MRAPPAQQQKPNPNRNHPQKNKKEKGCITACNKSLALHIGVGQNFCPVLFSAQGPGGASPPKSPKIRLRKGDFILNYTENYQLNQWEPADRVLRTDFNEDNQKIEEALNAIPKIATGSYIGTGSYSIEAPSSLIFDFKPTMVLISEPHGQFINFAILPAVPHQTTIYTVGSSTLSLQWEGTTVSWWSSRNAQEQFNQKNFTYYYIAL